MNIKQASEQSGVSAPNIRFYEKEGLLTPARRQGNDYRDYTAGDVRTLKLIRMLRMLDMPLPAIQKILNGEQPLTEALQAQQAVLEQQAAQLAGAIRFCAELTQQAPQVDQLDVDDCLKRMQDPQEPGRIFSPAGSGITVPWQKTNRKNAFSSYSGGQHQHPGGFCNRLCLRIRGNKGAARLYQKRECTRSSRWMAFRIKLTAIRANTGTRSAVMLHPEQLYTGLPSLAGKLLRIAHIALPPVCVFAAIMAAGWAVTGGTDWLWLAALASGGVLLGRCFEKWL